MAAHETPLLCVEDVGKSFTMHLRAGIHLPVVDRAAFSVAAGECVVLGGPSGVGKSSLLRMVYGNYAIDRGAIRLTDPATGETTDLASADPRAVVDLRHRLIAYVSQFLRVVPRVPALEIVAEPLILRGADRGDALGRAEALLRCLNLPASLFDLPPATFSGGEKQRVNIARGFITDHPILLLDEPTASLDAENRDVVCAMIEEKKAAGTAVLGIFHDEVVRERIATRIIDVAAFSARSAA